MNKLEEPLTHHNWTITYVVLGGVYMRFMATSFAGTREFVKDYKTGTEEWNLKLFKWALDREDLTNGWRYDYDR